MKKFILALSLALAFLIVGTVTIGDYGLSFDAPGHMLRGQAYVELLLTGQKKYGHEDRLSPVLIRPGEYASRYHLWGWEGETPVQLPERPLPQKTFDQGSFYEHEAWNGEYFIASEGPGHPPLADIGAALFNRIFYQQLGIAGDIESYSLFYLLISAFGVFITALFTLEISNSRFASLMVGLLLAFQPLYIAESHINMKDPLEASLFAASIWSFWHWLKDYQKKWWLVFVAFFSGALAIKWNIIFLPIILLPWLFTIRKTSYFIRWFELRKLLILVVIQIFFSVAFLILIWPWLGMSPWVRLSEVVKGYWEMGTGASLQPKGFMLAFGVNGYTISLLFAKMPEIVILFLVIGIISVFRSRGHDLLKSGYLLLFWVAAPIIRISLPGMRSYAGIRQIMEVLPAIAILAGMGANFISQKLKFKSQKYKLKVKIVEIFFLLFTFFILLFPLIRLHPNENVYFNSLVGGVKGAVQKNLIDSMITNGNIYKQAALWLNDHAEKNANLALTSGDMYSLSPLWLRADISLSPYHFSGYAQKGEYLILLYNPYDPPVFAHRYPRNFLKPIHTISVDNVPLLVIFKNEPKYLNTKTIKDDNLINMTVKTVASSEGDFLEIDLGKNRQIMRIVAERAPRDCLARNYEFIAFIPEGKRNQPISTEDLYVLNERQDLGDGNIEYFFAAETARVIRIYPQSEKSCFARGKILSIKASLE